MNSLNQLRLCHSLCPSGFGLMFQVRVSLQPILSLMLRMLTNERQLEAICLSLGEDDKWMKFKKNSRIQEEAEDKTSKLWAYLSHLRVHAQQLSLVNAFGNGVHSLAMELDRAHHSPGPTRMNMFHYYSLSSVPD